MQAEVDAFDDPRIAAVLRQLSLPEAHVAIEWARKGCSWWRAAANLGIAPAYGYHERVRRKLKRLGDRHTARAAAARARG
ncbi:hypothetical protein G5C51_04455 [Streptomyces sp. A7024]|uniref:Uncharacterized protein n=1 Tax=Streptomyces coryli TaxID=1128680 RepID=A0A6G4TT09_9ACTN|nr:hypothetical protein [Streptomyces coryli]NGN63159.1 hypothetical protein [Streptomyces coryli]